MRPGLPLSILLHAGIVASAYVAFPHTFEEIDEELIIVPIDLVVIDDTTNLALSKPDEPEDVPEPEKVEEPEPEDTPEPLDEGEIEEDPDPRAEDDLGEAEPIPEDEPEPEPEPEEAEPTPTPTPTPKPTPTPTPTPAPPEPTPTTKKPDNSFLDRALQSTQQAKKTREREIKELPDLKEVKNARESTRSAGDRQRDTATWTALLKTKLTKCFADFADFAEADRLRTSYQINLNKDGTLLRPPRRIAPAQIPLGDQQLRVFDINAQRAIKKCEPYDDIFPPELYEEWKDFTFNFGK